MHECRGGQKRNARDLYREVDNLEAVVNSRKNRRFRGGLLCVMAVGGRGQQQHPPEANTSLNRAADLVRVVENAGRERSLVRPRFIVGAVAWTMRGRQRGDDTT